MTSKSPAEKRLFLGIPAPEGIFQPLQSLRQALEAQSGIRWVKAENLHVTVFFFGQVAEEMIPNLIEMIRATLREFAPFELIFDQFVPAPKARKPRMIWARYHKTETFRLLVNRITDLYAQIQPRQQQRKSPVPHITVARLRAEVAVRHSEVSNSKESEVSNSKREGAGSALSLSAVQHFRVLHSAAPTFQVERLVLWSSDLQPGGAVYAEEAAFSL